MKRALVVLCSMFLLLGMPRPALAEETSPSPSPIPTRRFAVRTTVVTSHEIWRDDIPSGTAGELDALVRLRASSRTRFDLGFEGRTFDSSDARHHSLGPVVDAVLEIGRHFEVSSSLAPHHTWIDFKSPLWEDARAFGTRFALNGQLVLEDRVIITFSPLAANLTRSDKIGTLWQYEPRFGFGVLF
jgi:hypothetical protein